MFSSQNSIDYTAEWQIVSRLHAGGASKENIKSFERACENLRRNSKDLNPDFLLTIIADLTDIYNNNSNNNSSLWGFIAARNIFLFHFNSLTRNESVNELIWDDPNFNKCLAWCKKVISYPIKYDEKILGFTAEDYKQFARHWLWDITKKRNDENHSIIESNAKINTKIDVCYEKLLKLIKFYLPEEYVEDDENNDTAKNSKNWVFNNFKNILTDVSTGKTKLQRINSFQEKLSEMEIGLSFHRNDDEIDRFFWDAMSFLTIIPAIYRACTSYWKYGTWDFMEPESKRACEYAKKKVTKLLTFFDKMEVNSAAETSNKKTFGKIR